MPCQHCDHDIFEHLDRAVVPCASECQTGINAATGQRMPRATRCPCPGYEAARADD